MGRPRASVPGNEVVEPSRIEPPTDGHPDFGDVRGRPIRTTSRAPSAVLTESSSGEVHESSGTTGPGRLLRSPSCSPGDRTVGLRHLRSRSLRERPGDDAPRRHPLHPPPPVDRPQPRRPRRRRSPAPSRLGTTPRRDPSRGADRNHPPPPHRAYALLVKDGALLAGATLALAIHP
jgi:hypothetical protein